MAGLHIHIHLTKYIVKIGFWITFISFRSHWFQISRTYIFDYDYSFKATNNLIFGLPISLTAFLTTAHKICVLGLHFRAQACKYHKINVLTIFLIYFIRKSKLFSENTKVVKLKILLNDICTTSSSQMQNTH